MGRIPRRKFLFAAGTLLAMRLDARAEPVRHTHRLGLLLITSRKHPGADKLLAPFLEGLRERGYVEGRNLRIDWREADGRFERLPALAADLVALKPDLIVAGHHDAGVAVHKVTAEVPIVIVAAQDLVRAGLIRSYPRPGTNVTGVGGVAEGLYGKQLELLRELVPGVRRLAVLHGPAVSEHTLLIVRGAADALAMEPIVLAARTEVDLDDAFRAVAARRAEGLLVILDAFTYVHRERIARSALELRIAAVSSMAQFAEAGGLAAYLSAYVEYWRMAVDYVDRILKGAKPADLPVQMPLKFELVANLKTAKALGITVPQSVLLRADRLIE